MKIFILAGEPSGDEYGAELMKHILAENPNTQFSGIGGNLMEAQGLKSIVPLNQMSVMGFIEIIKNIPFFIDLENKILNQLKCEKPDKVVLIDYPGLNLRLCKKIKSKINIPIFYYISPQIWAWKEKRIATIKNYVDKMIVIFEFEKTWYADRGLHVDYVGHPFLDVWKRGAENLIQKYNLNLNMPILTLFPGSRNQEIKRHLNLYIKAALKIKNTIPDLQILLGLHPNIKLNQKINEHITVVQDMPLQALEIATAAIVTSGTATLQAAIMNTPSLIIYKMNKLSWWLTQKMVKVNFASMANIVAGELVFPELLQNKANTKNIVSNITKMLLDKDYQNKLNNKMNAIQNKIGESGASKKASDIILGK